MRGILPGPQPGGSGVESVNGKAGIVNLTTADVADSNDKRYVTEAEKTKLSNLSGTNTGDQNSSTVLLSAALPAPLSSETTVQGALASIAPLLGAIEGVPAGAIIIWTGTACPAGWSRETALDGLFLKGAAAEANPNLTPAGSNTHAHNMVHSHGLGVHTHPLPSHTHTMTHTHSGTTGPPNGDTVEVQSGNSYPLRETHDHDFTTSSQSTNDTGSWSGTSGAATGNTSTHSGDTATASNEPQHVTVLFCKKD